MNKKLLGYAALFIAIGLLPAFGVYPVFVMKVLCYALFACAFNLLVGFTGLLSFGHAAFLGTAAYVTGHALKVWGLPTPVGILVGMAGAAGVGLLFGLLAIRRSGIYFSMITLAFAQLVYFIALRMPFTGGENGIQEIPRPMVLGLFSLQNTLTLYYFVAALIVFGFWLIYRVVHSPFGQILRAIRDNEPRAQSLGYRVNRYKLLAFVLSAGLAGLAGSLKVLVFQLASLTDVHWATSGEALLICIVGGMHTLLGPVVGAIVIVSMENYLASFAEWVLIIQGVVFVLVVMLFRKGIVGQFHSCLATRRQRRAAAAP